MEDARHPRRPDATDIAGDDRCTSSRIELIHDWISSRAANLLPQRLTDYAQASGDFLIEYPVQAIGFINRSRHGGFAAGP